jgi:hypothetical protein
VRWAGSTLSLWYTTTYAFTSSVIEVQKRALHYVSAATQDGLGANTAHASISTCLKMTMHFPQPTGDWT